MQKCCLSNKSIIPMVLHCRNGKSICISKWMLPWSSESKEEASTTCWLFYTDWFFITSFQHKETLENLNLRSGKRVPNFQAWKYNYSIGRWLLYDLHNGPRCIVALIHNVSETTCQIETKNLIRLFLYHNWKITSSSSVTAKRNACM